MTHHVKARGSGRAPANQPAGEGPHSDHSDHSDSTPAPHQPRSPATLLSGALSQLPQRLPVPQSRHMPPRPDHRCSRLRTAQGGHDAPQGREPDQAGSAP
jgi:hypothetical protein